MYIVRYRPHALEIEEIDGVAESLTFLCSIERMRQVVSKHRDDE